MILQGIHHRYNAVYNFVLLTRLSQERVHGQDNGLSISTKHCTVEESGAIEVVLVNTNQFYKWFTDLEATMKSRSKDSLNLRKHRSKLKYFDELENVATNFYSPNMNVANGNFLPFSKDLMSAYRTLKAIHSMQNPVYTWSNFDNSSLGH
ncbi:hypothetical protein LOK49_LG12G02337 [Camellia lanceoleosa]|uniref:Uncharacterized protein n=1 Tax=Camellia lanceoleosa TaxID=1840588 RepID=A0ACC0FXF3_9ERIC|nr:hypothetical protein LOK49_LG12G02337 [Camellia lanceoleosa]